MQWKSYHRNSSTTLASKPSKLKHKKISTTFFHGFILLENRKILKARFTCTTAKPLNGGTVGIFLRGAVSTLQYFIAYVFVGSFLLDHKILWGMNQWI